MADAGWLTPEEVASLDALYEPIEPFDAWADLAPSATVWQGFVERWEDARREASSDDVAALLQDVTRGAAFDTGAIEGLYAGDRGITRTVMAQAATWEAYVAQERGPQVVEFVKAHVEGFEMALDVVTGEQVVTEAWIRQVHEVVCAPQDEYEVTTPVGRQRHRLPKGQYKTQRNHVRQPDGTPFPYAPVDRTPSEMARLVEQLRSDAFAAAHPATQAAYAHYAFVRIHPFADGNGRVARVLASVPLLRALSVPLVIYADQRDQYIDALERADAGDRSAFVRFVAERTVDLLDLVATLTTESDTGTSTRRQLVHSRSTELTANRLVEHLAEAFMSEAEGLTQDGLSHQVAKRPTRPRFQVGFERGYKPINDADAIFVLSMTEPRVARATALVAVGRTLDVDEPFALQVATNYGRLLSIRLDEVHPELKTTFRLKTAAWMKALVNAMLNDLAQQLSG